MTNQDDKNFEDNIVNTANNVIKSEIEALNNIKSSIDDNFIVAVKMLLELGKDSKVIVSGIGKAGFIGMKISATLASTGVPSFFLHPAEAIHGDLGRFRKHDIALILSNSGETEEVLKILPSIKIIGCPVISITGNSESTLAKNSDIVLSLNKTKEACPLGLAPTSSTTAMLVLGDALAMAILKEQNFTAEQFAFYHPGGALGRSLMKVSEIMRTDDKLCIVNENDVTKKVIQKITETKGRPGAAIIVNNDGILVGIYTDGNLRRNLSENNNFLEQPVKNVMGKIPKKIHPDKLIQEASRILREFEIDQIIVADEDNIPVGLIDIQDIYKIY